MLLAGVSILALLAATSESGATTFGPTSSIVSYTIADTGIYDIKAAGAQGGFAAFVAFKGGRGAWMEGLFNLTSGDVVQILVGGTGVVGMDSGDGVGGSFVAMSANAPLLVAGGGGGAGAGAGGTGDGAYGWAHSFGINGSSGGRRGTSGAGNNYDGANFSGGGGFKGSGVGTYSNTGGPGASFLAGGAGGAGNDFATSHGAGVGAYAFGGAAAAPTSRPRRP